MSERGQLAGAFVLVPLLRLAEHSHVQFNYFRAGIGTCEVAMH
jgi:hypothetical protein